MATLAASAGSKRWDAIVIGSGAGGSTLALQLARHGARVLVVERGDFVRPEKEGPDAPIGRYLYDVWTDRRSKPFFVGGQTKFYGAALYRLREHDFRAIEHSCGLSPAWPITYAELEPYYQEAEEIYRVHGALGGDPHEPPHASPYPFPAVPHHPIIATMAKRLSNAGVPVTDIPRALDYGPGGRCVLCATCDGYYCRLDAKMDAETAALRPALATGNAELLTRTQCLRVEITPDGKRALGAVLQDGDDTCHVRADAVVVSAGIPETALLLRRSRTEHHPDGLGNVAGALGRYHSGHSVGYVFPLVSVRKLPPIHSKTIAIHPDHDATPGPLGFVQMIGQMPFWEQVSPGQRPFIRFIGERSLAWFYATEALPSWRSGIAFRGDEIAATFDPTHNLSAFASLRRLVVAALRRAGYPVLARRRPPYLWHEAGTACFGADPLSSVCDPDCQVHEIDGLYVVDQSVLPSAGSVNTTLTVIALAVRLADHIAHKTPATRGVHAPEGAHDTALLASS